MAVNYLFRVVYAAVSDLVAVLVEEFSEFVIFGKVLGYLGEALCPMWLLVFLWRK